MILLITGVHVIVLKSNQKKKHSFYFILLLQPVAVKVFAAIGDIHPLKMLRQEVNYISI